MYVRLAYRDSILRLYLHVSFLDIFFRVFGEPCPIVLAIELETLDQVSCIIRKKNFSILLIDASEQEILKQV